MTELNFKKELRREPNEDNDDELLKHIKILKKSRSAMRTELWKTPKEDRAALIRKTISEADLAVGLFDDFSAPHGLALVVIKVEYPGQEPDPYTLVAIPCRDYEEANTMRKEYAENPT
jgi:hypothetical protein